LERRDLDTQNKRGDPMTTFIYIDEIGNTFADLYGTAHGRVLITLSGGTATASPPTPEPVGELRAVEIDATTGHLFVRDGGRFVPVGADYGAPSRGIVHQLSTDGDGNLFTFAQGRYLATTVVA
jgi:hypothetical protein